jgi:hypothetical protein
MLCPQLVRSSIVIGVIIPFVLVLFELKLIAFRSLELRIGEMGLELAAVPIPEVISLLYEVSSKI